ncbi:MAG: hypothetical protein FJ288_05885 [Planctomycetes bacterium]|nr:hypothetical protein [Planctomycetota bacterium]
MLRYTRLAAVLASAVLVVGCFEGKADFTFNPDGSGKVTGELLFPSRAPWLPARRPPKPDETPPASSPEDDMRECVTQLVKRSYGIDAWKDVSFERAADGRVRFKGTAYFKDLAKVRIYPDDRSRIQFGPDGTNALLLILARSKPQAEAPKPSRIPSPEEMAKRMKDMRQRYSDTKGALTTEVAGMKLDLVFHVPGTLEEMKGLEQQGTALSYAAEGSRIIQAVDSQVADGSYLRNVVLAGKSINVKDMVNEKVFGLKGEVWARWKGPFRARFDYAAEANPARKAQQAMFQRLGLDKPRDTSPPAPPAPAPSAPPTSAPAPATDAAAKEVAEPGAKPSAPSPAKGPPSLPMPDKPPAIPVPIIPWL